MAALAVPAGPFQTWLAVTALTIVVLTAGLLALTGIVSFRRARILRTLDTYMHNDPTPCMITTLDGTILGVNPAGTRAHSVKRGDTLVSVLHTTFANAGGTIQRLGERAAVDGSIRETFTTRRGEFAITVHALGTEALLWRIDPSSTEATQIAEGSAKVPMVMLSQAGTVLFMTEAARDLVGFRATSIDRMFASRPVHGEIAELSTKSDSRKVLVADVDAGEGRRALFLLPVPQSDQNAGASNFHQLPVPLLQLDPEGKVLDFNAGATELIGEKLRKGVLMADLLEGLGRPMRDWVGEVFSGRAIHASEFLEPIDGDDENSIQVTLKRIKTAADTKVFAVLTDGSELKSLQAQLVQSQKMTAIGQLAGGVAHDFNNLLTAISGYTDLLLLRHDDTDPDYADLIRIRDTANRAASLVGQLLAFSRKQTLRAEKLDLRETLADLTHLLNRLVGERVTLTLTHDPVLPPIRADKRQLEQVIMNLVVNARDAMPDGGDIRIETECQTLNTPMKRERFVIPAGQYVSLRVVDQGTGIPKEKLDKVFEPFYTTKRAGEGTGLGLSTAYGIVKQTGGYIFVDSVVGSGTCFSLMLPILDPSLEDLDEPATAEEPQPEISHGAGVILLVEDEEPVRAFASRALQLRGYTVIEADSAETALDILKDRDLSVDLFVTDVVMPGQDGPSWVRQAMTERPNVRVVFVSGYAEDKLSDDKTPIPNSVFLPKPFSLSELASTVYEQLH